MGRRAARSLMGLPNDQQTTYKSHPFALAYNMKVIIPIEIGMPVVKMGVRETKNNNTQIKMHLDWADGDREAVVIRIAAYH